MTAMEIAVVLLLIINFIILFLTDFYVKAVSNYCRQVEKTSKLSREMMQQVIRHCDLLTEQYEALYAIIAKEHKNEM